LEKFMPIPSLASIGGVCNEFMKSNPIFEPGPTSPWIWKNMLESKNMLEFFNLMLESEG
jgi:hypothetical protein